MKLKFTGYSDDTFGEYGVTNVDVDNCAADTPIQCLIKSKEGSLVVVGHCHIHPLEGCWTIGISMEEEESEIPNWPVKFAMGDCPYSPTLEIDVPDDAKLTWFNDGIIIYE